MYLKFGRWPEKVSPVYMLKVLLKKKKKRKEKENRHSSSVLKQGNLNIGNFAKFTEWPQTELKESDMKGTLHMHFLGPRVPHLHPFRTTINRFQDIVHFLPLTCKLIFHSAKKSKTWLITKKINILYSITVANVDIRSDDKCRRSSVWKFPAPYGPVLTKKFKMLSFF